MRVNIWEMPERVLAALNGTYDRWGAMRSYWNEKFRSQLRQYIDEWLDTGREGLAVQAEKDYWDRTRGIPSPRFPMGTEVTGQRNINRAPTAHAVATEYMRSHPPTLLPSTAAGQFLLVFGLLASRSPADEAARLFCVVLLSAQGGEWGACLAKCRYGPCGCYFLMHRSGRAYRNGTFCSREHNKLASAAACTQRRRQQHDTELIECAARLLGSLKADSPAWSGNRSVKEKLVLRLNKHLDSSAKQQHRCKVTLNWVTRNAGSIEAKRTLHQST